MKSVNENNVHYNAEKMEGEMSKMDKTLPELYAEKEECCGCTACYAVCPKAAIAMLPDEEGFLYPVIDADLCIKCYQCVNVCPIKVEKEKVHI